MTADPPMLTERLTAAFDMARTAHDGDTIKGSNLPYLLHLLDVCSIALRHGADEDQAIASLLHDVVEDGGGAPMLDEIRHAFGDRVADIVLACSDSVEVDRTQKADWWARKIPYLDHLEVATTDVALVSGADKLSNARSIVDDLAHHGDGVFERFKTKRAGTLWYYRRIAAILPDRLPPGEGPERLGAALRATVDELIAAVGDAEAAKDWSQALAREQQERADASHRLAPS